MAFKKRLAWILGISATLIVIVMSIAFYQLIGGLITDPVVVIIIGAVLLIIISLINKKFKVSQALGKIIRRR